ncbi:MULTISPECIES: pyruvate, water dikinase regulatory protein [unclassified Tessaracoccus]|uniref:pyruvate, water dikinase regulatory protein n=1 Tax=unclassified Tessaracoccus TaxID=2635419 RepID=UPI00096D5499|nr:MULTISPECIES: pyruvate, water dikinase regulatory protein [unclassified Tessaracoccus]MBB1510369.1 kinase/pyrophosphorylase [Tessaracoccus sp. MC1756]MCG6567559.1 kinase/pyrophosphorylase [Tessaracoccus sp. ZS01]OMG55923.1 phosphoenolpyruvate synthase regulatory protein [Tessaracoccus sp. ZS01]
MSAEPLEIHIIADSTGETAARIARAAITQFPTRQFSLVRHRKVGTTASLLTALETIKESTERAPVAVFFTLVSEEQAELVKSFCNDIEVPFADLMTQAMGALERISGIEADQVPMRPLGVEAEYFVRMAAIDFAVRHDDGSLPEALKECDICLVGPSRSGKTPLSIYLGYLGYKAVNVPLVPGIEPPKELWDLDRWRIIGLTMDAERLNQIRGQRVRGMGGFGTKDGYADLVKIYDELDEIGRTQRKLGCPIIDTTGVAIEEAASRIIDVVDDRARKVGQRLRRPPGIVRPGGAWAPPPK